MKTLNNKNYIAIADWMIQDLDLSGRELLTYAIIYGFSQDGQSSFTGSLEYLAAWLNISHSNNVLRVLKSLQDKKLITKQKIKYNDRQVMCSYKATVTKGKATDYKHIFILPWTIEKLELSERELILYALIHGFSASGSDCYCTASYEYFSRWLNVRKDHIKDRYLDKLKERGLIEILSDQGQIKYKAIIPQIDSTSDSSDNPPQNDSTLTQTDSTLTQDDNQISPKVIDNILSSSKPKNRLLINNNYDSSSKYQTKEELSVVVNKSFLPDMNFLIDYSLKAFTLKLEKDFGFYQKYRLPGLDIAAVMSGYARVAQVDLEMYFAGIDEEGRTLYEKGNDLLLKIITNKRFAGRYDKIAELPQNDLCEIYQVASRLFSEDEQKKISFNKSRASYLIGVIENILDQRK